jgi:hypothetical protein
MRTIWLQATRVREPSESRRASAADTSFRFLVTILRLAHLRSGGVEFCVARADRQKYNPNPNVGPCAVSFTVRSLLATESVIFRYRML